MEKSSKDLNTRCNENIDIEDIFRDLREVIGVEVEGRGEKLVYEGKEIEFTITPDYIEQEIKDGGLSKDEEVNAIAYIEGELKRSEGYGDR